MVKKDDDAVLAAVRKVLEGKGSRRSRLDQWMTKNYVEFTALMEGKRVNWEELTRVFESMGLGEEGKPMGPHTARQTWWKVRRRNGDVRKRGKSKPESTGLAPDIIREVAEPPSDRKHRVSPVSPLSPTVSVRSVEPARERSEKSDPDEVMRKLADLDKQMNAGRLKMPDPIK